MTAPFDESTPSNPPLNQPQPVHMSRAVSPEKPPISDDIKARHEESVKRYPMLNLSEAEYVIRDVSRHPIGLLAPLGITILLIAIIISTVINYPVISAALGFDGTESYQVVGMAGVLLALVVGLFGYVATWIYLRNRFFLTNESVIQHIQTGLFSRREQTVSLANIEDASYQQQGILQTLFNYGSIRLSTEGEETTYRFSFVDNPKQQIAALNNAVEAFKNGRPVD